jgi:hypothetical protein
VERYECSNDGMIISMVKSKNLREEDAATQFVYYEIDIKPLKIEPEAPR